MKLKQQVRYVFGGAAVFIVVVRLAFGVGRRKSAADGSPGGSFGHLASLRLGVSAGGQTGTLPQILRLSPVRFGGERADVRAGTHAMSR